MYLILGALLIILAAHDVTFPIPVPKYTGLVGYQIGKNCPGCELPDGCNGQRRIALQVVGISDLSHVAERVPG